MARSYHDVNEARHKAGATYKEKDHDYPPKVKKGALHKEMGIPEGKKIGRSKLKSDEKKAKARGDVKRERQDQFALNFNE